MNTNYHTINIKDTIKNQKSGQNDKIEKIWDTNKNGKHHEPPQKPNVRSGVPDEWAYHGVTLHTSIGQLVIVSIFMKYVAFMLRYIDEVVYLKQTMFWRLFAGIESRNYEVPRHLALVVMGPAKINKRRQEYEIRAWTVRIRICYEIEGGGS